MRYERASKSFWCRKFANNHKVVGLGELSVQELGLGLSQEQWEPPVNWTPRLRASGSKQNNPVSSALSGSWKGRGQPCSFPVTSLAPFQPSSLSPLIWIWGKAAVGSHCRQRGEKVSGGRRPKRPFLFTTGVLTIARGLCPKGKEPDASRREPRLPQHQHSHTHLLDFSIPGRPCRQCQKISSNPQCLGES